MVAEFSDLADQASGSVSVKYGETVVFATAVMSKKPKEGAGFFPLTVDYEEKFYAAGKIMGGRFMKREGKPSEEAILTCRVADRTIRPLFNQKIRNEIQVIIMSLSVDGENDTDIPAIIAASLALGTSDIPWNGPVGAVRIGSNVDGSLIVNPTYKERETCLSDLVVCGANGKINMVEAGAKEISEDVAVNIFKKAVEEITKLEEFQKNIIKEIGKPKRVLEIKADNAELHDYFTKNFLAPLEQLLYPADGKGKADLDGFLKDWREKAKAEFGDKVDENEIDHIFEKVTDELVHNRVLEAAPGQEKRPDGRKLDEIRPLFGQAGYLKILHGSGIFYRGATHVLSVVTLGSPDDGQLIEGMEVQTTKHFMHHYNFPPFSTGETGRMGGTGRREIGHGALAERALSAVIPSREIFPYTIRIVSESMASNGSTSQASICASTLALMDAGVPIKNPVAGIAMGLMMSDEKNYRVLTDIQGPEDHHGDMDFKCAGTKDGLTAIQMDVKVDGVTLEILEKALAQAKKARLEILEVITKAIPEPRKELSEFAPRIFTIKINPEKIKDLIGPGGKMINSIIDKTGAEINVEQDGTVFVTSRKGANAEEAKKLVEGVTHEYKVGEIITGPVTRLFDFGAMVEIGPGTEGLVHVSEMANYRVNAVRDIVKEGDIVTVKLFEIDEKGRLNLSIKRALPPESASRQEGNGPERK